MRRLASRQTSAKSTAICAPPGSLPCKTLYVAEVVDDGACGFAWVKIRPANAKLARWLKAQKLGHKAYNGGWDVSVHDFGQSWERKSAAASAMAAVLVKHGIDATYDSRMD